MYSLFGRRSLLALLVVVTAIITLAYHKTPVTMADGHAFGHRLSSLHEAPEVGSSILYEKDGVVACRQATLEEAQSMMERKQNQRLHVISPIRPNQESGLKITLRGTSQLENFPEAKAAFLRAAATWESLIQ